MSVIERSLVGNVVLPSFSVAALTVGRPLATFKIAICTNMCLCSNPPIKWQTLLRMKYVLCSVRKRQYKQHDGEKMAMWNSAHSRFIKLWKSNTNTTEKFIKHVLPAKVRAINRLENTNYRTRTRQEWGGGGLRKKFCVSTKRRTRHPLYDDQQIRHYVKTPSWIQNSNQYPRFHVPSLFPHYCIQKLCKAKLSHKILFEDK